MELILYPNRRIDQPLLIDGIKNHSKRTNRPVNMRILKCDIVNRINEDQDMLKLYVEIRQSHFYCNAYCIDDGVIDKTKTEKVKASWETVLLEYELPKQHNNNYRVEIDNKLFYLLNHALQQRGKVMTGNKQGFKNLSYHEIVSPLTNMDFKGLIRIRNDKYMIIPVTEDVRQ